MVSSQLDKKFYSDVLFPGEKSAEAAVREAGVDPKKNKRLPNGRQVSGVHTTLNDVGMAALSFAQALQRAAVQQLSPGMPTPAKSKALIDKSNAINMDIKQGIDRVLPSGSTSGLERTKSLVRCPSAALASPARAIEAPVKSECS